MLPLRIIISKLLVRLLLSTSMSSSSTSPSPAEAAVPELEVPLGIKGDAPLIGLLLAMPTLWGSLLRLPAGIASDRSGGMHILIADICRLAFAMHLLS